MSISSVSSVPPSAPAKPPEPIEVKAPDVKPDTTADAAAAYQPPAHGPRFRRDRERASTRSPE